MPTRESLLRLVDDLPEAEIARKERLLEMLKEHREGKSLTTSPTAVEL